MNHLEIRLRAVIYSFTRSQDMQDLLHSKQAERCEAKSVSLVVVVAVFFSLFLFAFPAPSELPAVRTKQLQEEKLSKVIGDFSFFACVCFVFRCHRAIGLCALCIYMCVFTWHNVANERGTLVLYCAFSV